MKTKPGVGELSLTPIVCEINSWVLVKEFNSCSLNDMVQDWVSCILDSNRIDMVPLQRWNPLDIGKCKVDFDGASFGNPGSTTFRCVMRDCQGNIIGVKGGSIGVCDVIHVETMGLLEGLKLAKSKSVRGCILKGDSLTVISWGVVAHGGCNIFSRRLSLS